MLLALPREIHQMPSSEALPILGRYFEGRALLFFSGGKDGAAAAIAMRPHFPELELAFAYWIPGLRLVEEALGYFERLWGKRIHRLPHPAFYKLMRDGVDQTVNRIRVIEEQLSDVVFTWDDHAFNLADDLGWRPDTVAQGVGVRKSDSIFRRAALKHIGPYNSKRRVIYPIYDWSGREVADCLEKHGVLLPAQYRVFGRSFDGLDFRFMAPMKEYYPDDFERVKAWFPMIEAELMRYEFARRRSERAIRDTKAKGRFRL